MEPDYFGLGPFKDEENPRNDVRLRKKGGANEYS
jgi:hypothetical protein